jgi:hypothetical protein
LLQEVRDSWNTRPQDAIQPLEALAASPSLSELRADLLLEKGVVDGSAELDFIEMGEGQKRIDRYAMTTCGFSVWDS